MISQTIEYEKKSLLDRGIPDNSYFEVVFSDGSKRTEHDTNWSSFSKERIVNYLGGVRKYYVSEKPLQSVIIRYGNKTITLDVPQECSAYQAIYSRCSFLPSGEKVVETIARVVGIVKDNIVIEEKTINKFFSEIYGFRL